MPWKKSYITDPDFSIFSYQDGVITIIPELDFEPFSTIHITPAPSKIAFGGPLSETLRAECKKVSLYHKGLNTKKSQDQIAESLVDHLNGCEELIQFLKDRKK
jgi:hypothetical protein